MQTLNLDESSLDAYANAHELGRLKDSLRGLSFEQALAKVADEVQEILTELKHKIQSRNKELAPTDPQYLDIPDAFDIQYIATYTLLTHGAPISEQIEKIWANLASNEDDLKHCFIDEPAPTLMHSRESYKIREAQGLKDISVYKVVPKA